jgi:nucleotide-binding universal stress UspA family protein
MGRKIVLGLDGSAGSLVAAEWCADIAKALEAEVIAVHGLSLQAYPYYWMPVPTIDETWHKDLQAVMEHDWCKPLEDHGIPFRAQIVEDEPAQAIMTVADREQPDLVVVGRRGRGTFAEALLGSVSHRLVHQAHHPVVIVPKA